MLVILSATCTFKTAVCIDLLGLLCTHARATGVLLLVAASGGSFRLTVGADDTFTAYSDGVVVVSGTWPVSTTVTINAEPCVLAITGERHTHISMSLKHI